MANFKLKPKDVFRRTGMGGMMKGDDFNTAANNAMEMGLDPYELYYKDQVRYKDPAGSTRASRQAEKDKEEKRKRIQAMYSQSMGMKKGGKVKGKPTKCGMGGYYRKK